MLLDQASHSPIELGLHQAMGHIDPLVRRDVPSECFGVAGVEPLGHVYPTSVAC